MRKAILLGMNVVLLSFLFLTGSLVPPSVRGQRERLIVPDHALVYELKLVHVTMEDVSENLRFDAAGHLRVDPQGTDDLARVALTLSGTSTVYLVESAHQVISGADVTVQIPLLGLDSALEEVAPGVYAIAVSEDLTFTAKLPVPGEPWRIKPLGMFINNRLVEAFSFSDYAVDVRLISSTTPQTYEIPIDIRFEAQILTSDGNPVVNQPFSATLKRGNGGDAEEVPLITDKQGIVAYERQETILVTISQGALRSLATPLEIPGPSHAIEITSPDGSTHTVALPVEKFSPSSPVILFWGGGTPAKEPPSPSKPTLTEQRQLRGIDPKVRVGDPINLATGNVFVNAQDFFIPGKGLPIAFQRTYNSREDYSGPLGYGWTHSYNINLTEAKNGTVTEMAEDGTRVVFSPNGDGSYQSPTGNHDRLTKHGDKPFSLTKKHGTVYSFDAKGKLTSLQDRNGNRVTLTYGTNGNLVTITDSAARQLRLTYDSSNRIIRLTDPADRQTTYTYDSVGNLASVADPGGNRTRYSYTEHHQLITITDANGNSRHFTYDDDGLAQSFSYDQGHGKVILTYNPATNSTSVTNAKGYRTDYFYTIIDDIKVITKMVDPLGQVQTFTWDQDLNRTSITDQKGQITRMTYDSHGNLLTLTDPLGNTTTFAYDSTYHFITSVRDAEGNTTTFAYDANGNLTTSTDPLGHVTTSAYDSSGQLLSTTDPKGRTTTMSYDLQGNLATLTDALGQKTTFAYDKIANVTGITDAKGNTTTFTYDKLNRRTSITRPDGTGITFTYDGVGNRLTITDPLGHTTTYRYDLADRLEEVVDPLNQVTSYAYDAEGNLIRVIDANGNTTTYTYDALNRLVTETNAEEISTTYTYDAVGNRTGRTDGNGNAIDFRYDAMNRLTQITYPDKTTVQFTYDRLGRRQAMTDVHGTTSYTYDRLSRLTRIDGPAERDTISYTYDAVGNRVAMTNPDGEVTTYTYDALNRLIALADPRGQTTTYTYDKVGNVTEVSHPNRSQAAYTFDALNRLLSLANRDASSQILSSFAYTYDKAGRRTQVDLPKGYVQYTYDNADRLITEVRATPQDAYTIDYKYDAGGNRTTMTKDGYNVPQNLDHPIS